MVYGWECEVRHDENSDYTCAEYYSLLIMLRCVILFILQRISVTNIILCNNAYDLNITCLLLRSVKICIIYTRAFSFFPSFFFF